MSQARKRSAIYIAAGANLGDRAANIRGGLLDLERLRDIRVVQVSTLHETRPVGGPVTQPDYLNAAAELETRLTPRELLNRLLETERRFGRDRSNAAALRDGPRTLDLDLLIYHDLDLDEPGLTVPHPRMWQRAFVLKPLAELCDIAALRARFGIPCESNQMDDSC